MEVMSKQNPNFNSSLLKYWYWQGLCFGWKLLWVVEWAHSQAFQSHDLLSTDYPWLDLEHLLLYIGLHVGLLLYEGLHCKSTHVNIRPIFGSKEIWPVFVLCSSLEGQCWRYVAASLGSHPRAVGSTPLPFTPLFRP